MRQACAAGYRAGLNLFPYLPVSNYKRGVMRFWFSPVWKLLDKSVVGIIETLKI
jgi:hypothetical protein